MGNLVLRTMRTRGKGGVGRKKEEEGNEFYKLKNDFPYINKCVHTQYRVLFP
jgi:hypothetical protein